MDIITIEHSGVSNYDETIYRLRMNEEIHSEKFVLHQNWNQLLALPFYFKLSRASNQNKTGDVRIENIS